jgi:uncharacterized protein YegL
MSNMYEGVEGIVRREMVLFFLIDQSGSMEGVKMGAVNAALREVLPQLKNIGGSDAKIKVAFLLFSSGCEWLFPEPIAVDDPNFPAWKPVKADGMTDFGEALKELTKKMSKNAFLSSPSASYAPAIFLMSDGQPSDEYKDALKLLKENRWFQNSIRVAVAIGNDADKNILTEFTGNSEAVLIIHTPEALIKVIRFVTVTSSKIGSDNKPLYGDGQITTKQEAMVQKINDFKDENPEIDQNSADAWD